MKLFSVLNFGLVALLFAVTASAQPDGRADPAKPLAITLVATTQYATHDFYARTLNRVGPDFRGTTRIFPGQRIDLVVLAQNYALNPASRASLVYDLAITYPGGSTQSAGRDLRLCVGPVPDAGLLAYASQTASFNTDPGDPLGTYTFAVTARDRVANETLTQSIAIQVVPYVEPPLPADFNPGTWMGSYYLNPSPALALPALFRIAAAIPKDNTDAWPPVLGFYEALLKANPWLTPVFQARLKNASPADRNLLEFVLGYAWRNDPAFAGQNQVRWPDVDTGDLNDPMQLDVLWGRFFATGAFAPVERIASALRMHACLGALDKFKVASPHATTPSPEVMKELVLKSAQWSLGRNARVHPLVRRYCEWLLAQKDPDAEFNALLTTATPVVAPLSEKPAVFFPRPSSPQEPPPK